jgi:hypothetical protein
VLSARDARIMELEEARIEAETSLLLIQGQSFDRNSSNSNNNKHGLKSVSPITRHTEHQAAFPDMKDVNNDDTTGGGGGGGGGDDTIKDLLPPDLSLSISKPLLDATKAYRSAVRAASESINRSGSGGGLLEKDAIQAVESAQAQAELLRNELNKVRTLNAEIKAQYNQCMEDLGARNRDIADLAQDIRYYAKQAQAHGLSGPPPSAAAVRASSLHPLPDSQSPAEAYQQQQQHHHHRGGKGGYGLGADDVEQLKKVSSTTINSLKTIIEEKNKMIEKYKHKLEAMRQDMSRGAIGDKEAIERLTNKMYRENEDAISQLKSAAKTLEKAGEPVLQEPSANDIPAQLYRQLEEAALGARQREDTIAALELKLRTANNQRFLLFLPPPPFLKNSNSLAFISLSDVNFFFL